MAIGVPLVTGLFSVGEKLIERLFPDPEQKAKAEAALLQMQSQGELERLALSYQAIIAEANSEDKWTSRARPSFMYCFYFILINLTVIGPVVGVFFPEQMTTFFNNVKLGFDAIPEDLWWLFGAGFLGYTTARTFEKRKRV